MRIGLDVGSTTIKTAVLDEQGNLIHSDYQRHYSQVSEKAKEQIELVRQKFPQEKSARIAISGSAGMGMAEACSIPFIQEVYATRIAAERLQPDTDAIIELGGEDAKILFLGDNPDARMNGTCAGGTGAFIDQMATLLHVSLDELNELSKRHEKLYTIASRCGVFAKSDIQPLLNQGAQETDIAASIFAAVVSQTIGGLAQGRKIEGNVLYLGGPLSFLSELRRSFVEALGLHGTCPENSLYYVALGAAYCANELMTLDDVLDRLGQKRTDTYAFMEPLFQNKAEYQEFSDRHARATVARGDESAYADGVYVGIDAGSTTVKFAVIDREGQLVDSQYQSNSGNPVPLVKAFLQKLYEQHPDSKIVGGAVTGYGEDLIQRAFGIDFGIVETVAHFTAAKHVEPEVDFILDIGGQDMKCMRIHNGVIDNIYLNEACSSGCGSFLQTFANAMDYEIDEFARKGLFADKPVDLGSRCTVFMNSSVKQAQKDGASTENISAGLSISVVKNALYKVIRPGSIEELGEHIVVQGGTFHNDAVLRAFEQEMGHDVIRPDIAGLMGAYGAALYAREKQQAESSTILDKAGLDAFRHEVKAASCGLCPNNCRLTINQFSDGKKYISGNRCERPITHKEPDDSLNLYAIKLQMLREYMSEDVSGKCIGIPMGLNMFELLPLWKVFFESLGLQVVTSSISDRDLYLQGQGTIPSDTVCYPAKLMHGHMQQLIDSGVKTIFYPCMTYNFDEKHGDNHFNCPVVAYYPEVIQANMSDIEGVNFIGDHLGLHNRKAAVKRLHELLVPYFQVSKHDVSVALKKGMRELAHYQERIRWEGKRVIGKAELSGVPTIVMAGRPYHIDPEINHGIDRLVTSLGAAVVSEDAVATMASNDPDLCILNQWTYHSRLFRAAQYVADTKNAHFVQLVSFGCGCDAITTDECRRILEENGKIYTQIKIDEIENLGAAKIRVRSLFAAI